METRVIAAQIHDQMCGRSTLCCPRWGSPADGGDFSPHRQHYEDMAYSIIEKLEPVIGIANVRTAVRVILEELS